MYQLCEDDEIGWSLRSELEMALTCPMVRRCKNKGASASCLASTVCNEGDEAGSLAEWRQHYPYYPRSSSLRLLCMEIVYSLYRARHPLWPALRHRLCEVEGMSLYIGPHSILGHVTRLDFLPPRMRSFFRGPQQDAYDFSIY